MSFTVYPNLNIVNIKQLGSTLLGTVVFLAGGIRNAIAHPHIEFTTEDHVSGQTVRVYLEEDYHPILIQPPALPPYYGESTESATILSIKPHEDGYYIQTDGYLTQRNATVLTHNAASLIETCFGGGLFHLVEGTVIGDARIWKDRQSPSEKISDIGYISRCPAEGFGRKTNY